MPPGGHLNMCVKAVYIKETKGEGMREEECSADSHHNILLFSLVAFFLVLFEAIRYALPPSALSCCQGSFRELSEKETASRVERPGET